VTLPAAMLWLVPERLSKAISIIVPGGTGPLQLTRRTVHR